MRSTIKCVDAVLDGLGDEEGGVSTMSQVDDHAVASDALPSMFGSHRGSVVGSDDLVERVLRWAVIEQGTASLSDNLGAGLIAPRPPTEFLPPDVAIAGKVVLLRRQRPPEGSRPPSSFDVVRGHVTPGCVVIVRCDPGIGAAFGSNVALQAAACRAQALVADGAWRDTTRLQSVGIPVGGNGADPMRPAGCPMVAVDSDELFGLSWNAGDWFLRDADGVMRLDGDLARRAAAGLAESASGELASLLATSAGER